MASTATTASGRHDSIWHDYLVIARVDHWFKNLFVLPGTALAILHADIPFGSVFNPTLVALAATCLMSSANYVINEWLDAATDRHHPLKKDRPGAAGCSGRGAR